METVEWKGNEAGYICEGGITTWNYNRMIYFVTNERRDSYGRAGSLRGRSQGEPSNASGRVGYMFYPRELFLHRCDHWFVGGHRRGKENFSIPFPDLSHPLEEYRTKDKLYAILRTKGYSLGQGLDIVETAVTKSRELELPLSLIMAVIHEESEFYPNARSDKGAQGLMQIMPAKWDEYVVKLNLKVDRRAITDPLMNISVGAQILKDLYDRYSHIEDDKTRMAKVLTDYNNGESATNPNLEYAVQVSRRKMEYEKKLQ